MSSPKVYIIAAIDQNRGMGYQGHLPWHLPKELAYFQATTTKTADPDKQNMVIMGRTSWEALPGKQRPLKNRLNVVLSRNPDYKAPGALVMPSLSEAIRREGQLILPTEPKIATIYIIGGAQVIETALKEKLVDGLYITHIAKQFPCDTFFPKIPWEFSRSRKLGAAKEQDTHYEFWLYEK